MSSRTITVDDLTGQESAKTEKMKVRWDGKEYTLDLSPDSKLALGSLLMGNGPELMMKLLAPAPAPNSGRKSKASKSANDENRAIREWWATPEGRTATETAPDAVIPARGRIPDNVTAAYRQANPA